jgi:hypothetical protein
MGQLRKLEKAHEQKNKPQKRLDLTVEKIRFRFVEPYQNYVIYRNVLVYLSDGSTYAGALARLNLYTGRLDFVVNIGDDEDQTYTEIFSCMLYNVTH